MNGRNHILLDLDGTLYTSGPAEDAGARAVVEAVSTALHLSSAEVSHAWDLARRSVKSRLDGRACSHSRLLYLAELVHALRRADALPHVRTWERAYWRSFLAATTFRPRARAFLERVRSAHGKVAIVSDLTLEVQLMKLETFGVLPFIDALATSEEVPLDKPDSAIFDLAMTRLGARKEACVVVGDRADKDGEGARRLGIPYFQIDPNDDVGTGFDALAEQVGLSPSGEDGRP